MSIALIEFFVELYLVPSLKTHTSIVLVGLVWTCIGECIRKVAMITAKQSFTHLIKDNKREEHKLITHGIYKYVRHPGYFGWFLWSVGGQVLLCNPLCVLLFTAWSWYFFNDRIPYEEEQLVKLFGQSYRDYKSRTPTYIPFIQ